VRIYGAGEIFEMQLEVSDLSEHLGLGMADRYSRERPLKGLFAGHLVQHGGECDQIPDNQSPILALDDADS
jgi:hypothetical protein